MLVEQGTADWIPDLQHFTVPTLAILSTRGSDRFVEDMWKPAPAWGAGFHMSSTNRSDPLVDKIASVGTVKCWRSGIQSAVPCSTSIPVSYTHLRAHETGRNLV